MDAEGRCVSNVYASGWAANGARGVLASSMYDAYDVADTMVADQLGSSESLAGQDPVSAGTSPFESAVFPMVSAKDLPSGEHSTYPEWLERAIRAQGGKRVTTYDMWRQVDAEEIRRGQAFGKERERMTWKEVDLFLAKQGQLA